MKNKNIKIIDNYLSKIDLEKIKNIIFDEYFSWYFIKGISEDTIKIKNQFYYVHMLYRSDEINSNYFKDIISIFSKNKFWNSLYRVKVNSYPNNNFVEHPYHTDFNFRHNAALFSLNTCDGYTKFEDGTKVDSVENRMIFFDPTIKHSSTNTTNADRRININFNYF